MVLKPDRLPKSRLAAEFTFTVTSVAVPVEHRIRELRGMRVILDRDLAEIYGVETRALNQAVKRNKARFPDDFAFRLEPAEITSLRRSRSQIVILNRGQNLKHVPWAFSEHGALMAASVLNSSTAVEMSVFVVRAFVRLRDSARQYARLAEGLAALERKVTAHDDDLTAVIATLRRLVEPPSHPNRKIGFRSDVFTLGKPR